MAQIGDILKSALSLQELNAEAPGKASKGAFAPGETDTADKATRIADDFVKLSPEALALANGEGAAGVEDIGAGEAGDIPVDDTAIAGAYGEEAYSDEAQSVDARANEDIEAPRKKIDTFA